jgi:hypothetical protein|tara:strand:- start:305 stop:598 length:294 start_codon:yes stop_codon:yes gene_type:complete
MCGCNNNKKIVNLPHLKIYLIMAKYSIKEKYKGLATSFYDGLFVRWDNVSQEELAHIYEEVNGGKSFVNKIEKTKKSNEESTIKASNKKTKSTKKDD